MQCPNCQEKNVGKIGRNQFFCWNCCIEMVIANNMLAVHQVESDGSLSPLNDVLSEEMLFVD